MTIPAPAPREARAVQLHLVQFDPVQQIAAAPDTLKAFAGVLREHTAPVFEPRQLDFLTGLPLVTDPTLPEGFVYLRPTPAPRILHAPWTPEQVGALNLAQRSGGMHPLSCGGDHPRDLPTLIATRDGWTCPDDDCTFTQPWAYAFMTEPRTSTGELLHPKDPT